MNVPAHSDLEKLAVAFGIETSFIDARGVTAAASASVIAQLLASFGVTADTDEATKESLRAFEISQWRRIVPAVRVFYVGSGEVDIEVVQPRDVTEIAWRATLEDGGHREGSSRWGTLKLIATQVIEGCHYERRQLVLKGDFPTGYHQVWIGSITTPIDLIVTPGKCWTPSGNSRMWGVAAQLYLIRANRNWGIGDFTDLKNLMSLVSESGGDVVGVNPLHAMFTDKPAHASPYSPASRLLLNVLNIDIEAIPEYHESAQAKSLVNEPSFQAQLSQCRNASLVEYETVARLKSKILRVLFEICRDSPKSRWKAFLEFRAARGPLFELTCVFLAMRQHFVSTIGKGNWRAWPDDFRDKSSEAVRQFASDHAAEVTFCAWMQWIADHQLQTASDESKKMRMGLYRDLAVGADPEGAETWSQSDAMIEDARVGAPPDLFNPLGQNWGLPPFNPHTLHELGYRPFIELLRANMRHAGALRIDHAMGLLHLYLIPEGNSPRDGAYVRYPIEDLVGILALESQRARCLIVGEDLGTVPAGFRERMAAANILSYRVMNFERDETTGALLGPDRYPALSLAVFGSHDLPTLRSWWAGDDIKLRDRLSLFPSSNDAKQAREQRIKDRGHLLNALRKERLIDPTREPTDEELLRAVHAFLSKSGAMIAMAQLDDIGGEITPVNMPCTTDEYPNWRRRLADPLEHLQNTSSFKTTLDAFGDRANSKGRQ